MSDGVQLRSMAPLPAQRLPASLAHEINNPLDMLFNLIHLVEAEPSLTIDGRRHLQLAREEIHRLKLLVGNALNNGRHALQRQETNIPELLDEVVELYRSRLDANGIAVDTRYRDRGSLSVVPQGLRQAFSNLLLNAADAMSKGGTLRLRVCRTHQWSGEAPRGIRVTFADNGTGITSGDLERIFQPFFSTKGSRGNGVGLSMVKYAVAEHHGVLHVRSTVRAGRSGSVFAIFLPDA